MKVFIVSVIDESRPTADPVCGVFAKEADALQWVWQDMPPILSSRCGRTVHLAPTERTYGTEWRCVSYRNGMPVQLGICIGLTERTLIGGEA